MKALVVDDSKVMRTMVKESLRRAGLGTWDFVEACDGPEAVAAFSPGGFDVVLVDWNMPEMSGIDVVARIRHMPGGRSVPVVMLTSDKTPPSVHQTLRHAGVDACIIKPFTIDALRIVIGRAVESASGHRRPQQTARPSLVHT